MFIYQFSLNKFIFINAILKQFLFFVLLVSRYKFENLEKHTNTRDDNNKIYTPLRAGNESLKIFIKCNN